MKKKRFSVEQITAVLQQVGGGVPVWDVCRQVGISEQTFYRWKKVYGGMPPSEARELKQLRDENTKLKRLVADLSLDKVMLQDVFKKGSKARQTARGHAVIGGPLLDQHASGLSRRGGDTILGVLPEPQGPADGVAPADARAGANARAVRPPAPPGLALARRVGGRQGALLSRVLGGRPARQADGQRHDRILQRGSAATFAPAFIRSAAKKRLSRKDLFTARMPHDVAPPCKSMLASCRACAECL